MEYTEYLPAHSLSPFIDCYWSLRAGPTSREHIRRIIPDTCADIILNLGEEVKVKNGQTYWMKPERTYLVGTMTTFHDTLVQANTHLIGIRFKPFGLSTLLKISLQGTSDTIEELDRQVFSLNQEVFHSTYHSPTYLSVLDQLNSYFSARINEKENRQVNGIVTTILEQQGKIKVSQLAQLHHLTERQLERKFEASVGVSLKEICNLARFRHAFHLIQARGERSLADIAFEVGYYDHAHLTKHFRRYAGYVPSQL